MTCKMAGKPIVLVEWVDSWGGNDSWSQVDDYRVEPLVCRSVGWLLHDTEECKVIVPHVGLPHSVCGEQARGEISIPSLAVINIIQLREGG